MSSTTAWTPGVLVRRGRPPRGREVEVWARQALAGGVEVVAPQNRRSAALDPARIVP